MTDSAALLVDEVLPQQPLRQWVLSLPFALRFLLATDADALTQVLAPARLASRSRILATLATLQRLRALEIAPSSHDRRRKVVRPTPLLAAFVRSWFDLTTEPVVGFLSPAAAAKRSREGAEFAFTTSGDPGAFDVGDVGAHEIGHLLGLDHSGWAGATMYPYVDPTTILHRSMSLDEIAGAREIAPVAALGRITGTIERLSDGSPVSGAHVVALDAGGRNAASALTNAAGAFTIFGLDAGTYTVYADPLDSPVSSGNLSPGHVIEDPGSAQKRKIYRGMTSPQAVLEALYDEDAEVMEAALDVPAEGQEIQIPYKGSVVEILHRIRGHLRSAVSYGGADSLQAVRSACVQSPLACLIPLSGPSRSESFDR